MISRFSLLLLGLALAACDGTQEETGPYDCSAGSIPNDAQCLDLDGSLEALRFTEPGVIGVWSSNDFETCITYAGSGTASFRYWGLVGGVPRENSTVKWGIWIDAAGDPILSNTGQPAVINIWQSGEALDRRLIGIGYTDANGLGADFERVDACPDNRESNQGMLTFYSTNDNMDPITIGLDSFVIGELSAFITGDEPECGDATSDGVLTVYRQPGTYRFQAFSTVATWGPTNLTVEKGECASNALR